MASLNPTNPGPRQLPIEIHHMIFNYRKAEDVKGEDLRNLRLACHDFAGIGLGHLDFSTAFMSKFPYDLIRYHDTTDHPIIQGKITTIICDDSNYTSESCMVPGLGDLMQDLSCFVNDTRRLCALMFWYVFMCVQESGVRASGMQMIFLLSTLGQLQNLRRVFVTDFFAPPESNERSGSDDYYETPFHRSGDWDNDAPLPQGWHLQRYPEKPWDQFSSCYYGFTNMMRALSLVGRAIEELAIFGRIVGISHRIFDIPPDDFLHVSNVFASLKTLAINIDTGANEDSWISDTLRGGKMARVLSTAGRLECLELRFQGLDVEDDDSATGPEESPFDIDQGFGGMVWPHLHEFSLMTCELPSYHALVKFLGRHAGTLRSLDLQYIKLSNGTWADAFQAMKDESIVLNADLVDSLEDTTGCFEEVGDLTGFLVDDEAPNPADWY